MDTLFTPQRGRILTIGVGSLGCAAARMGAENGDEHGSVAWSAAHDNAAELIATGMEEKLFLKIPPGPFVAQYLTRCIDEKGAEIAAMVLGRDAVLLCGCLGEPHTGLILSLLSASISALRTRVFVLALEPHTLLSIQVLEELEARATRLAESVPFLATLNSGTEKVSLGVSTRRIQRMAAERLMGAAECFASGLDPVNETSPFLQNMRGTHRAVFASASGAGASHAAFELALGAFDETSRERLSAVILQSAEELPLRDARAILQQMSDNARQRAAVCASLRPAFAGQTACLLLSSVARTENVVGIEAALCAAE